VSNVTFKFRLDKSDVDLLANRQLDQVLLALPVVILFFIGVFVVITKGDFSGYKSTAESVLAFCAYAFFVVASIAQYRQKDALIEFLKKDSDEDVVKKCFCQKLLSDDVTNLFDFLGRRILVQLGQNNSYTQAYIAYMNAMKTAINDLERVDLGKAESLRRTLMNTSGYKQAMIFADRCQPKTGGHLRAIAEEL
jgi:hypothetical protein